MTEAQKKEALAMRMDGASFQEIGDRLGLAKQTIQRGIPAIHGSRNAVKPIQNCVYPNIERWRRQQRYSRAEFGRELGVAPGTISRVMTGTTQPLKPMVDRILALTGMTYEVAFAEDKKYGDDDT